MFNKKKKAAAEAARLADESRLAEIAALRAQLAAIASEKSQLENRITELADSGVQLDERLTALDRGVGAVTDHMARLAADHAATTEQLRSFGARVSASDGRVEAFDERLGELEDLGPRIDAINARLRAFEPAAPPAFASAPPPPPVPMIGWDSPDDEHGVRDGRVDAMRDQLSELAARVSSVDARITSVSIELANQLTELARDIESLDQRGAEAPSSSDDDVDTADLEARLGERLDVAIDDVLDATERLAAEQARYEIQFRADLADLAERIRRPGTA